MPRTGLRPKARWTVRRQAPAAPTIWSERGGSSATPMPKSATRPSSRPSGGSSSCRQPVAINAAGSRASSAVLAKRGTLCSRGKDGAEVVAPAYERHGHPGRFESKRGGVDADRAALTTGEAGQVDIDDRDVLAADRACDQRLDESGPQRGRDDDDIAGAVGDSRRVAQPRLQGPSAVLLGRGECLHRAGPIALVRTQGDRLRRRTRHEEARMAPASRMRPEDRARSSNLDVEARFGPSSGGEAGLSVEQDRDLVSRSVLELLDHQLPTPGGRGPMHPAQ